MAQPYFGDLVLEDAPSYLEQIKEFEEQPVEEIETDEFTFIVGECRLKLSKMRLFYPT